MFTFDLTANTFKKEKKEKDAAWHLNLLTNYNFSTELKPDLTGLILDTLKCRRANEPQLVPCLHGSFWSADQAAAFQQLHYTAARTDHPGRPNNYIFSLIYCILCYIKVSHTSCTKTWCIPETLIIPAIKQVVIIQILISLWSPELLWCELHANISGT